MCACLPIQTERLWPWGACRCTSNSQGKKINLSLTEMTQLFMKMSEVRP